MKRVLAMILTLITLIGVTACDQVVSEQRAGP